MKTQQIHTFHSMPAAYAALCRRHLPRPIHDKVGYQNALEIIEAFAGFEPLMNQDQHDYFDMLCKLIAEYEEHHILKNQPPSPAAPFAQRTWHDWRGFITSFGHLKNRRPDDPQATTLHHRRACPCLGRSLRFACRGVHRVIA